MNYVTYINGLIKKKTHETERVVLFGQNINAGSCLGGMTRGIKPNSGSLIFNSTNTENCLVGMGFGAMMNGVNAIFLMKQLDFLLLGIDQIVNTYNFIRLKAPKASFTIMPVVVDNGYQGLQSSLNNFGDFCSIARVSGYTFTNKWDSSTIIEKYLVSPGFRIIAPSQRLFGLELMEPPAPIYLSPEADLFQYTQGSDTTIVAFNYTFPQAFELTKRMNEKGKTVSLFSVNTVVPTDWGRILESVGTTKSLIVLNDSKSIHLSSDNLMMHVYKNCPPSRCLVLTRDLSGTQWLWPNPDILEVNYDSVVMEFSKSKGSFSSFKTSEAVWSESRNG